MVTILLLEPHPLLRLGLRHLLSRTGISADLVDLDGFDPDRADASDDGLRGVDLLVYGLGDGPGTGWDALDAVCDRLRPQRVLVLGPSPVAPPGRALPPLVRGYLSKQCCVGVFDAAVRMVLAGGECFPFPLQDRVPVVLPALAAMTEEPASGGTTDLPTEMPSLHRPVEPARSTPLSACVVATAVAGMHAANAPVAHDLADAETPTIGAHLLNITERQYEVLALLARGYPIKTVSRLLNISVATTKTHACTLYQRLQVRNKGEAVYVALQRGAMLNWPGPVAA